MLICDLYPIYIYTILKVDDDLTDMWHCKCKCQRTVNIFVYITHDLEDYLAGQ